MCLGEDKRNCQCIAAQISTICYAAHTTVCDIKFRTAFLNGSSHGHNCLYTSWMFFFFFAKWTFQPKMRDLTWIPPKWQEVFLLCVHLCSKPLCLIWSAHITREHNCETRAIIERVPTSKHTDAAFLNICKNAEQKQLLAFGNLNRAVIKGDDFIVIYDDCSPK